jgi:chain length determinant protein tyrosine kinase EpsG
MNSPFLSTLPAEAADTRIGKLLQDAGCITAADVETVLAQQRESGLRFGEAALRQHLVRAADVDQALARQFAYPYLVPGQGRLSPRLLAAHAPFSPPAEALRAIRSQVMLRWFGQGRRALAVMGADAEAGGALFAANLALVLSQMGEQTLLVEANLRQPTQQALFGLAPGPGLADLLAGRATVDVIDRVPGFATLSVLPAGTIAPNPQELLSRDTLRSLHTLLASRYDVLLYDLAPFRAGADALVVATRAGGVLLAARKHHSRLAELEQMTGQLAAAGAELLGAVLLER